MNHCGIDRPGPRAWCPDAAPVVAAELLISAALPRDIGCAWSLRRTGFRAARMDGVAQMLAAVCRVEHCRGLQE
jgi:hypothetical protein